MAKRRLPIGIQTFRKVREQDCYYVDKTPYIRRLLDEGTHYFLSRPRRFGKSLLLDTFKELFEANEPLFTGLHIHDTWDWSVRHPVVRLDFAGGSFKEPANLHEDVMLQLESIEDEMGIPARRVSAPGRLRRLLQRSTWRWRAAPAIMPHGCCAPTAQEHRTASQFRRGARWWAGRSATGRTVATTSTAAASTRRR